MLHITNILAFLLVPLGKSDENTFVKEFFNCKIDQFDKINQIYNRSIIA